MPFRVTMAALDLTSMKNDTENIRTSLVVRVDDVEYVLCNLSSNKTEQQTLNVVFTPGEAVTFFASGDATIHLTGNFLSFENEFDEGFGETLGANDTEDEDNEEDEDEEEEFDSDMDDFIEYDEEGSEVDGEGEATLDKKKSTKIEEIVDEDNSDIEEAGSDVSIEDLVEDEDAEGSENSDAGENLQMESGSDEVEDSDEEIDSDMADSDDGSDDEDDDEDSSDEEEEQVQVKGNDKKRVQASQSEASAKKAKTEPTTAAVAVAASKQDKPTTPSKVTTVNGVKIEEIAPGKGNRKVQDGNQVGILYTGTLSNGNVFDSNMKSGKPFSFKVGAGSVIKGFDIAVKGMSFNEVRKVTIPPHLAYGNKNLPGIPKNSSLTFEIKLVKF